MKKQLQSFVSNKGNYGDSQIPSQHNQNFPVCSRVVPEKQKGEGVKELCVAPSHANWELLYHPHTQYDEGDRDHVRDDAQHDHVHVRATVAVVGGPTDGLRVGLYGAVPVRVHLALHGRDDGRRD